MLSLQARKHAFIELQFSKYWKAYLILLATHGVLGLYYLLRWKGITEAAVTGFPLDDSWIHLVYAQSLAAFQGLAYNPGQMETGFTSPLWVFLEAPLFWIKPLWGGNIVYGVKALGLAVFWACSVLAFRLTTGLTGSTAVGLIAGLLVAVDPYLNFAALSGMEVLLTSATGLYLLLALQERRLGSLAIGLLCAPLARPENIILVGFAAVIGALWLIRERRGWPAWCVAFLPVVVALGNWSLYCWAVTGKLLPTTYYLKHKRTPGLLHEKNLSALWTILMDSPWMTAGVGLVLFVGGACVLFWHQRKLRDAVGWAIVVLVVVFPAVMLFSLSNVHNFNQTWPFYWHRYFEPVLPFIFVVIASAFVPVARWVEVRQWRTRWRVPSTPLALVLCGLAIAGCWRLPEYLERQSRLLADNCENINEMNVAMGHWVADNVPAGASVAINDAGAIRFFGQRRTLDLVGLNNHELVQVGRNRLMRREKPDVLVIFPGWFKKWPAKKLYEPVHSITAKNYTICRCRNQHKIVAYQRRN